MTDMVADRASVARRLMAQVRLLLPEADHGITEETDLRDFAGFDSLVMVRLLTWAEDEFGMALADQEDAITATHSVHAFAGYIMQHRESPE